MRLLRRGDDGKISLTKDLAGDDSIPPYAILSHTWAVDNTKEVTFEDMANGRGDKKPGYGKIKFCAEQAHKDRLEYFWIDTCCINKANRAELSQAISSMFRWYRQAKYCYVHLSDVSSPYTAEYNPKSWDSDFWKSRWFSRGWTLQELLAPTSVIFFSKDGKRLGDRVSLERQVHQITNLPILALQGAPLSAFGVEERFLWMKSRETTYTEDKVYSLLGIFDIDMHLDYGEGFSTARDRLQNIIDKREKCITDLKLTDPRRDKERIEADKGGLLDDSYRWILQNPNFQQWRDGSQSRLLWVKGDPGKGKTMLLCGIANELISIPRVGLLSYFFCQATDARINNAMSVLRGLIYLLIEQRPCLVSHLETKYTRDGKALFEDTNAWIALSEALTDILQDPRLDDVYLMVDALDECVIDLPKLLQLIVRVSSLRSRVKWIVSSRNWPEIEKILDTATQRARLDLELNEESVSAAVEVFIQAKVHIISKQQRYKPATLHAVRCHLSQNAHGTFLWVALVCKRLLTTLEWIPERRVTEALEAFPPGLDDLYWRMLRDVTGSRDAELCSRILAIISTVYRPLTLDELCSLVDMPKDINAGDGSLIEVIEHCGSFLTLRERNISLVHQSAKDFLTTKATHDIFPAGTSQLHYDLYQRSISILNVTLRRNIYNLEHLGVKTEDIIQPVQDPLTDKQYPCVFWIDHLRESLQDRQDLIENELHSSGTLAVFLQQQSLYWLEALSLLRSIPRGIQSVSLLLAQLQASGTKTEVVGLVYDLFRFVRYFKHGIENSPLQVYASGLRFAPMQSKARFHFQHREPQRVNSPIMEDHWNACQQTLEGHSGWVLSVAFSHDDRQIVSGSDDRTIRVWDAVTGRCQQTLTGHSDWVLSVAFSHDGRQIVSGSADRTIRVWDAVTGRCQQTLTGHSGSVLSVAFSHDGRQIVSGSDDRTIRVWDAVTGRCHQTLTGHSGSVLSVAFSHDGRQIVSGSADHTIRVWDAVTGRCQQTLTGHSGSVCSVAFSHDGRQIVSGSADHTIRVWDAVTGRCQQTLTGHSSSVLSVAFSHDGRQIVSGSNDRTIRVWDAVTGRCQQTLTGHSGSVFLVASSIKSISSVSNPSQGSHYGLSDDGSWVIWKSCPLIWIPPDFRPTARASCPYGVALGLANGRVIGVMFLDLS